jgi:alpha-L-fucosidase
MEVDYSQSKIYKIYIPGLDEIAYIGSTVQKLYDRFASHKQNANSDAQYKYASCVFFQEGNEPIIELIENYPCETKAHLLERERYWLDKYPEAVNKIKPKISAEELLAYQRSDALARYYKNHQQNIEKNRKYKEEHRDELNKDKRDKYQALTQEQKDAKNKADYERRKEKVAETRNATIECPKCKEQMTNRKYNEKHKKICT